MTPEFLTPLILAHSAYPSRNDNPSGTYGDDGLPLVKPAAGGPCWRPSGRRPAAARADAPTVGYTALNTCMGRGRATTRSQHGTV